jgi:hypothetical protein
MLPHLNIQTTIFSDVAALNSFRWMISEGVERMGNRGRTEEKHSRPRRVFLRVLGEIAASIPHGTPTRAATAAAAARLLTRLLTCDTQRVAS